MADKVGGIKQFKPKKKKIGRSKLSRFGIPALGFGIGAGFGYDGPQIPSITKAVTGKEDDVIDLVSEMGIIVGAEKGAKKAAQTKLLKNLLGKFTKGMGKRAALGAIPAVGPAIATGYGISSLGTIAKFIYDSPKEERDKYIEAIKQSPRIINELARENRTKTRKKFKKQTDRSKALFNPTKKELLERSKRVVRKKGGKVGRPKGVGCAIRGHGKAMKRGK